MPQFILHPGDCIDVLDEMEENSIDAVVTDPPYGLGFMGKHWDHAENVAFRPEIWTKVLRVLKPGGHIVAFSGTRTYHRMVVAIEDAGFEVRDQLAWVYGSGFPKSHNLPGGFGTALKPAYEPIVLARKPLSEPTVAANVLRWGVGALNIDATRIATDDKLGGGDEKAETSAKFTNEGWKRPWMEDARALERQAAKVRANVEKAETLGRWPANLAHDGSEEVLAGFPESGGSGPARTLKRGTRGDDGWGMQDAPGELRDAGSGSAARFFYCAKANKTDRAGSKHPTVKPVALMRWLVRMVTPPGGTVLDPFAGTGTTGQAALEEGFNAVLIEREEEYRADIERRMGPLLPVPEVDWLDSFMSDAEEYLDA